MIKEVFNRYESKFKLNETTYLEIISEIDKHLECDEYSQNNSFYTISNIYYDTEDSYLIRTSLEKPTYKEKLRLRSYGQVKNNDIVFLEIKKKVAGLVNKRRIQLELQAAENFIKTKNIPNSAQINLQVAKEIYYFLNRYQLKPTLYLSYERRAYFQKGNSDLRITFDKNIKARRHNLNLFHQCECYPILEENMYIMEVKSSTSIPLWLISVLSTKGVYKTSFSKYGTEYQIMNEKKHNRRIK